ncbi:MULTISPECIES: DUF2797 domain-containing protein [Haladaptatus]|uniref:DUF2797 domain-containing protein n=1 Tax=Haladaptatus paucihalophilus DX253 TaxID=797209 RepID=A0A1M6P2U9_HALPU|nr:MULTISPECIES: DUF2797 domain-containing protein [Haladaptatus]GKZ12121.1 hypothetical protein HAL_00020 [Haladaptatus sp. T7]SHK02261.1 Protein of unknown function [Haladaptatus paucihalophilus DX253]
MQIVGYETGAAGDDPPALLVDDDGTLSREPLERGVELEYTLGDRHCAGTFDGSTHIACSRPNAPYCDAHTSTWVCARCTGTCLKAEMDCYEDHAIYLAAFGPTTVKVGVTREWRLQTRLREQGADRAAHLQTVKDGRIARELEAEIAETFTDRVRVPAKIRTLDQPVDEAVWRDALSRFDPLDTFSFDYGFELESAPVHETLASGTVLGTQGRVLVLERGGTTYATDMRDLVGYELERGATDRSLQASLGTF